jgi:hypothetical protein
MGNWHSQLKQGFKFMAKTQKKDHERRGGARIPVNARVMLVNGTIGEIMAYTRDISDSGVFLEIQPVPRLPIGAHIKMHMLDSAMPNIAFNMKVARVIKQGLGLMFIDFEKDGNRYSMDALKDHFSSQK